jgi:two-component system, chemotaxis family, chemotaxis protein CheY
MRSLVVDDEFVALHKMIGLLAPLGECDAATNGQQAVDMFCTALAGDKPYDLVTIDIEMPVMGGIAVLRRLQFEEQNSQRPPAAKIMVSAAASPTNVMAAGSSHCQAFLVKPVRREMLMEKLVALGLIQAAPAPSAPGRRG